MASPKLKIQGGIKKGVLTLSQEMDTKRKEHIKEYKEGAILDISFKEHKKTTTDPQRKYYWKIIVEYLCEAHWGETDADSKKRMNEHLKLQFNPIYYEIADIEYVYGGSFQDLETDVREEKHSEIRMWASTTGVIIPLPNEVIDDD